MLALRLFLALLLCNLARAGVAFHEDRLRAIDDAIAQAVTDARTPGAVFRLEKDGVVHQKAYGSRALVPVREAMTEDTIFDAASLTKVIATSSAVMKLAEAGKLDLDATADRYLPEFTGRGKEEITLRHLLTHSSGLRAGLSPDGDWKGRSGALKLACLETPTEAPGTGYRYSDINFIVLGFIVERVSGKTLDAFCAEEIFEPLGMEDTGFRPLEPETPLPLPPDLRMIAPTEVIGRGWVLRGVVHDPTSRRMGGVAGHAGLFTTTSDLGRFARMMLGGGELDGVRIFRSETVAAMTSVQSPAGLPRRGFGWDIDSPYAGPRGEMFPIGSYGHTGWTGTRLWIDPFSKASVIFLSNRNHPDGKGGVVALQRELGTLAAQAIPDFNFEHVPGALAPDPARPASPPPTPGEPVLNGIDVVKRDGFRQLRGCKIGLITNQTGIDRERHSTIDLLKAAPGLQLVALFSPEHGIRGDLDREGIGDLKDEKTGLPVYSLYGERRSPAPEQLAGIDTLVFDIQDIGCRFYTYISTMTNCMEAAGKAKIRFIVLDRVNPIGPRVEGPVLTAERSFVGAHEIPLRHGMTVGELARLIDAERKFGAKPEVIRCEGGSPLQWFDGTGLPWQNPSPNMRGPTAAVLYPGVGLLEFCKLSVGRGTDTPFELLGAPYIDEAKFSAELNRADLQGVRFVPVRFTPAASVFAGEECRGVRILLTDRESFRAADLGIALASTLQRLYAEKIAIGQMAKLAGDEATLDAIRRTETLESLRKVRDRDLADFLTRRTAFLLYDR
ncbi:exo-beta-N-acetylmuramidase NamZ domain-containing protein [Luteolibacter sp. Populi]|uniref:exo-beta-N-acetylmuramidase NamZ domain-containing protein n=1 Tax=Luteolibacter sp. Populi TaxID=3230487 RepID=UPI003467758B